MSDIAAERPLGFVDGLIESYAPKAPEFEVVLEKGDVLRFRGTRDYEDLQALRSACAVFVEGLSKSAPPNWQEYATKDRTILARAHYMSELSVEPRLTPLDCLKLAKLWPHGFDAIYDAINQHLGVTVATQDAERAVESKNGSGGTPTIG